jgi:Immunoglobulin domain
LSSNAENRTSSINKESSKPMKSSHHIHQSKAGFSQNPTRRNGLTSLLITLMASVAILALSATSAQAAANVLLNPGFELGATNWSPVPPWTWTPNVNQYYGVQNTNNFVYDPAAGANSTIHTTVHGGTNALKVWGFNVGNYTTTPGLMQTLPAAPGSTWAADGWFSTQAPDSIRTNKYTLVSELAYLRVMFLNAATNYNAPLLDCYSAIKDTNAPVSTWIYLQVTNAANGTNLVAPAGTAFVRYEMIFSQPSGPWVPPNENPAGSAYFDDVRLSLTSKPDPEITIQPVPQTKAYSQTATFSVTADGLSTLSYQWLKNEAAITDLNASGISNKTLTLTGVTAANAGDYSVRVTDLAGSLESDPATLTVLDPGIISITPPVGQTVVGGSNVTMSVVAAGSSSLNYTWYQDSNPLSNDGHYSGVTTPTLHITGAAVADSSTNYNVQINGGVAAAATGLKVVSPQQLATNLIVNPGFEDSVFSLPWETAWGPFNGAGLATANDYYYLTATPVSVYDGLYVARTYNNGRDNGIYQNNVPATPGATYHAGGYFYVSSADPVADPAWDVLQVFFKDVTGNTILSCSSQQMGGPANQFFTNDTWASVIVTNGASADLVAPAGTVSATVQVYEYCQAGGGGSVYFDDLYLTKVATTPPLPPAFSVTASVSSGQFNLSFPTTSGTIYEVLYTGNAASALSTWQTNTTVIGDGTVKTVPDTLSAGARFYRVRAHNP